MTATEVGTRRFDVGSAVGTLLAVWVDGEGPPLVLVHGSMETAVRLVLVGIVGVTEAEMDALRSGPRWPTMLASVPTVPRECRVEDGWRYRPAAFDGILFPSPGAQVPPGRAGSSGAKGPVALRACRRGASRGARPSAPAARLVARP
jgi:hypothetical protein